MFIKLVEQHFWVEGLDDDLISLSVGKEALRAKFGELSFEGKWICKIIHKPTDDCQEAYKRPQSFDNHIYKYREPYSEFCGERFKHHLGLLRHAFTCEKCRASLQDVICGTEFEALSDYLKKNQ